MKLLTLFILLLSTHSFASISQCGDDSEDLKYRNLTWELAATYKVNTIYIDLNAIVCAGVNYKTLKIERIHYRDNSNVKRSYSLESLKNKDIAFLKRSDFPASARLVTRSIDPLTLKVTKDNYSNGKRSYSLSFKFVRNMARGFSATDIRDLQVQAELTEKDLFISYQDKNQVDEFNGLELNISGGLNIETIHLLRDARKIKTLNSLRLPKGKRS